MAVFKVMLVCAFIAVVFADEKGKQSQEDDGALEKRGESIHRHLARLELKIKFLLARQANLLRGRDGRDGKPGRPGKDGKDGKDGNQGARGSRGPKGNPGRNGQRGSQGPNGGGLQYVRWGKKGCQGDATVVYQGRMAGEHFTHPGGGVNYLCITLQPKWLYVKHGFQSTARLFGAEYEVNQYGSSLFGKALHDKDAPCVVCHVKTRSAKLMVPGTFLCPAGWKREYFGYLMTEFYNHPHPRDFVCVDKKAEAAHGSHANHNGALLYPVEGQCGSLPCPPYGNGKEITCAVCTK